MHKHPNGSTCETLATKPQWQSLWLLFRQAGSGYHSLYKGKQGRRKPSVEFVGQGGTRGFPRVWPWSTTGLRLTLQISSSKHFMEEDIEELESTAKARRRYIPLFMNELAVCSSFILDASGILCVWHVLGPPASFVILCTENTWWL